MEGTENGHVLQFAPFQSSVDVGFWHELSLLKLNKLKNDESPISIIVFYTPCSNSQVSSHLTLLTESLPTDPTDEQQAEKSRGNRNKCSVPDILYNTNTLEGYHALDKQALLKAEAKKIWDDIRSRNGSPQKRMNMCLHPVMSSICQVQQQVCHCFWSLFHKLLLDL